RSGPARGSPAGPTPGPPGAPAVTPPDPPEPPPRLRDELLGPAHALRELGGMLLEDVTPHGPPGLIGDLQTVQAVATHLEDLVVELLDRLAVLPPGSPALAKLRHDVRTPL